MRLIILTGLLFLVPPQTSHCDWVGPWNEFVQAANEYKVDLWKGQVMDLHKRKKMLIAWDRVLGCGCF